MTFSYTSGLIVMLCAMFLYGSWSTVLKFIKKYPPYAIVTFMMWSAFIFVWLIILIFGDRLIPGGFVNDVKHDVQKAVFVAICGAMDCWGIQCQLEGIKRVGLVLTAPVKTACLMVSGITVSALIGGVDPSTSIAGVAAAVVIFVAGSYIGARASFMHLVDVNGGNLSSGEEAESRKSQRLDIVLVLLACLFMCPFHAVAYSAASKTPIHPEGFEPLTLTGVFVTGSAIASFAGTFVISRIKNEKEVILHPEIGWKKLLLISAAAGTAIYTGKILNAYATPSISAVISTTIGNAGAIWNYFWGIVLGEYKGSQPRTIRTLALGIGLFLIGLIVVTVNAA